MDRYLVGPFVVFSFVILFVYLFSEIGSHVARKERRYYVLLKAVYSGTFQHACRNLSLGIVSCVSISAPNRNPLYNPSTTPHQPSPQNLSSLAFVKWPDPESWCACAALTGRGLFSGI